MGRPRESPSLRAGRIVKNQSYNGRLAAGQSTSFGFQGTGNGSGAAVTCAGI
ncbi:cellulose binding domain-containing protein [Micromonospora sp. Llam0]|uniref:cellulose binding domain-containing protein n=1 Tax=Micromonospora sp. Llam0 TaxID=2485143 RepID=UPI00351A1E64